MIQDHGHEVIAVIGGGIGGPACAIGLAQNGHNVTLYERASSLESVGFAFRITPDSDLCLKYLGIDTMDGGAVVANTSRMMDYKGNVIFENKENTDSEKAKKGSSVFAYRPHLQQQLLDRAKECGVRLETGVKVLDVDVDEGSISLENGSKATADLIVAADGVHSLVRPHIVDSKKYFPKVSTGHGCLRFTIPKKPVLEDPRASQIVSDDFRMVSMRGNDRAIIVYPVDYDTQFNFTCTHPEKLSRAATEGGDLAEAVAYNHKISPEMVLEMYKEFDQRAIRFLELADPHGFRVWKLVDMDEIPRWSAKRTVLLGDACHPVLPFGFSGASMAIEDATTLAALLPKDVGVEQVRERLDLYEQIRRPRVERVRESSREIARGREEKQFITEYRAFLTEHDTVECARRAVDEHFGKE
ncbi:hypothetical protein LTR44_009472 [Exophiala sp. CCFEE 6388]|nr:hypothetical protein LTR44_009472 [Eurotiomycetes sp. CCFEE 6388]